MSDDDDLRLLQELERIDAELQRRTATRDGSIFIPHKPHPKQAKFLELDTAGEVLYGGSVGGGKSDALLMAALRYVNVPGYSALILRRTYQDLALPGAIMARAEQWLAGTPAKWHAAERQWAFPSGATLTFGYLQVEKDRFRYGGAEFQFIGIDELTQFPEKWYTFMFSRLRKPESQNDPLSRVPLRMRAATNPGNIGHEWVRERWQIPDVIDFDKIYQNAERYFVPARLEDNPSLKADEYDRMLAELGPAEREQLRHGRWVRDSGMLVYHYYSESCCVEEPPEDLEYFILGIDFGFKDDTAFAILGWRKDDPTVYVVECWKKDQMTPSDVAEVVSTLERQYKFQQIVGDVGGLGKGYAEEAKKRFGLPIEAADKNNKRGYIDLLNGSVANDKLMVVKPTCEDLIKEWKTLPWADEERKKEYDGFPNHCSDATLYAWRACYAFVEKIPEREPDDGTPAWRTRLNESLREQRRKDFEKEYDLRANPSNYMKVPPSMRIRNKYNRFH